MLVVSPKSLLSQILGALLLTSLLCTAADTDGDGLPDEWELEHFGNLSEDEIGDLEPDGLTNLQEFNKGTDPNEADSDGDGLNDGPEFNIHTTDPADADTDDDGLSDGAELNSHHTNPLSKDSDADGLLDGAEVNTHGTDPNKADSDGDGFDDGVEIAFGSDPNDVNDTPDVSTLDTVVINEFMAQNQSTLTDEDGDSSDWIELWNPKDQPISLAGWHLTDNPNDLTKWTFPAHTMAANSFLVLFASTKDRAVSGREFHTSFALEKNGGYLALTRPNGQGGIELVHHFDPYVSQPENVSFGLYGDSPPLPAGFFLTPTPRAANNPNAVQGFVADTRFSIDRGFYDSTQAVEITSDTPGASIIYTTNSTVPTLTPLNGTRVDAPDPNSPPTATVNVSRTTVLRAFAFKDDHEPTNVDTQTYLFTSNILRQGIPRDPWVNWGDPGPAWDMDASVVNHADPESRCVAEDLLDIPTLSISLPFAQMWGNGGIYISGEGVEKDCSIEYFNPNGDPDNPNLGNGFQIDGTVQIVGGSSTGRWKSNHLSMRVKFTKGDLRYKVFDKPWIPFGNEATDRFDTLVVDGRLNNVWNHPSHSQRVLGQYVRDQYVSDLQNALGGTAPHGRHMHVYVAGIYWGMHTIHERPDDNFAAEYFGGDNSDYDVVKHSGSTVISGTSTNYNALVTALNGDLSNPSSIRRASGMLDLEDFAKYMLVNYFCGNTDWDHHNWYASFNHRLRGSKWHFHSWDPEHVLKGENDDSTGTNNSGKPTGFQHRLMANPEYKLIFADLVRREMFNDGHLTRAKATAHYLNRISIIDHAIRAESARWGDNKRPGQPYTRGDEWMAELDRITNVYLRRRTSTVLRQLQNRGWYPATDAPNFAQHGGNVAQDHELAITSADGGTIYYTLDGSDPRAGFTSEPIGMAYANPVTLSSTGTVKARVRSNGGEWSALTEALFVVGTVEADSSNLVISELNYRPASPSAEEIAAGYNNRGDFEFVELLNVGPSTLDLSDLVFIDGIDFDFRTDSTTFELAPGARILVVGIRAAFEFRYGTGLPIAGVFQNATDLSNSGETITLTNAALDQTIQSFTYLDRAPWPNAADGHGYSLTLACPEPNVDHDDPTNWRASAQVGGSPGSDDLVALSAWLTSHGLAPGQETSDLDHDGLSALLEYALGTDPTNSHDGDVLHPSVQSLLVGTQTERYLVLQFPRLKGADDVRLSAEVSVDLISWDPAGPLIDSQSSAGNPVELLKIRSDTPAGPGTQFIRIRVEAK